MQMRFTLRCVQCFTRPAIHVLWKKFARGRESIVDKERPGRHVIATTDATTAAVDAFARSNRRVNFRHCSAHWYFTRFSAQNRLQSSQVSEGVCSMGAKKLKPEQLQAVRMNWRQSRLQGNGNTKNRRLRPSSRLCLQAVRMMTMGDETWVHHYQLETKQASRQWKHKESPTLTKFKVVPSVYKVMATMFCDIRGVLLV